MLRVKRLTAVAAAAAALLIAAPGTAQAAMAPAPLCDSGASIIMCIAGQGTSPFTWTVTTQYVGWSSTVTIVGGSAIRRGCPGGRAVDVSYSYVNASGQTIYSELGGVTCNAGAWP